MFSNIRLAHIIPPQCPLAIGRPFPYLVASTAWYLIVYINLNDALGIIVSLLTHPPDGYESVNKDIADEE